MHTFLAGSTFSRRGSHSLSLSPALPLSLALRTRLGLPPPLLLSLRLRIQAGGHPSTPRADAAPRRLGVAAGGSGTDPGRSAPLDVAAAESWSAGAP